MAALAEGLDGPGRQGPEVLARLPVHGRAYRQEAGVLPTDRPSAAGADRTNSYRSQGPALYGQVCNSKTCTGTSNVGMKTELAKSKLQR